MAATSRCKALIVHPRHQHTLSHEPLKLSFMEEVPDCVLSRIAACVDCPRTLARLMLVNKRCRRIAAADGLWRQLCITRFNTPPNLADASPSSNRRKHPAVWRDVYRFNHEALQWLLAQTAAEAMAKLGIRPTANTYRMLAA